MILQSWMCLKYGQGMRVQQQQPRIDRFNWWQGEKRSFFRYRGNPLTFRQILDLGGNKKVRTHFSWQKKLTPKKYSPRAYRKCSLCPRLQKPKENGPSEYPPKIIVFGKNHHFFEEFFTFSRLAFPLGFPWSQGCQKIKLQTHSFRLHVGTSSGSQ